MTEDPHELSPRQRAELARQDRISERIARRPLRQPHLDTRAIAAIADPVDRLEARLLKWLDYISDANLRIELEVGSYLNRVNVDLHAFSRQIEGTLGRTLSELREMRAQRDRLAYHLAEITRPGTSAALRAEAAALGVADLL